MYTVPAHKLPSARSYGEPLTTMINPAANIQFSGIVLGSDDVFCLLASTEGKGFICQIKDVMTKSRSGKAVLTFKKGYTPLPCQTLRSLDDWVAVITTEGRLLIYPVSRLPVQNKGQGVRLINIPPQARKSGEKVLTVNVLSDRQILIIHSGQRYCKIKRSDRKKFMGEKTQRGTLLPKGFRSVNFVRVSD